MENYLELIANDNESNANAILNEINLTEFLDDANDVSITAMGRLSKVGQRQWPLPANRGLFKKEIPQINTLKK